MNRNIPAPLLAQQPETPAGAFDYNSWRERFLLTFLRISCILGIPITVFSLIQTTRSRDTIIFAILLVIVVAVTFLRVTYNVRAYALLFVTFVIGINGVLTLGTWTDASIYLLISVVLACLLFDSFVNLFALGISFITLCVLAIMQQTGTFVPSYPVPEMTVTDWAVFIVNFLLTSVLAIIAIGQLKQAFQRVIQQSQDAYKSILVERAQLENKVVERTEQLELKTFQLQASTNIARNIAEIQNIPDLLKASVTAAAEQFGYYHVGIYLLDSRKKVAFLQASSSAIGEELIGFGHRVDVDTRNPISIAIDSAIRCGRKQSGPARTPGAVDVFARALLCLARAGTVVRRRLD